MTSLLEHNKLIFKTDSGWNYPEFQEYYESAVGSVWRHQEVNMESDIRDWQHFTIPEEQAVIAGILKGFTTTELGIQCYWGSVVTETFPHTEIQSMARAFSFFETIHANAYNYLNASLGLQDFELFIGDPIALKKVEFFFKTYNTKVCLGIFSGAAEGVSLFSSFVMLLSFNLDGRFKGLAQIISWSAQDEQLHSDGGISLFNKYVEEDGITPEEELQILEGFNEILKNEFAFIDHVFSGYRFKNLDPEEVKSYIRIRANTILRRMNLPPIEVSPEDIQRSENITSWFNPLIRGGNSNDFFSQSKDGGNYVAKISQDFNSVDIQALDLSLSKELQLV